MGTRHLIGVIFKDEVRVAQYGQWDGYPKGQGATVVSFITKLVQEPALLTRFKENLLQCRWCTEDEISTMWTLAGAKPGSEWVPINVGEKLTVLYPELSRDTGGDILDLVLKHPCGLVNSWNFGADSLFCEYAYVLDLDKEVLEFYRGFQKKAHKKGRFAELPPEPNWKGEIEFYPIKLVRKYAFNDVAVYDIVAHMAKVK